MSWQKTNFYPSNKPCCVCGSKGDNGQEPRFGYTVCETHSKLSPVQISNGKEKDS